MSFPLRLTTVGRKCGLERFNQSHRRERTHRTQKKGRLARWRYPNFAISAIFCGYSFMKMLYGLMTTTRRKRRLPGLKGVGSCTVTGEVVAGASVEMVIQFTKSVEACTL